MASEPPPTNITTETKSPKKMGLGRAFLHHLGRPMIAGPLLLSGMCMFFAYKSRAAMASPPPPPLPPPPQPRKKAHLQRSVSMAALHGGKQALERIMDSQEMRIDEAGLVDAAANFKRILGEKTRSFKHAAGKLEMSGREDEAVKMLKEAVEEAEKLQHTHDAYELQMILVEMLIYEGKYNEALKCKCLDEKDISDARRPLYKAVIQCILGDIDRAKECYKEFQDMHSRFHWPDGVKEGSPLHGPVSDFEVFENIVNNLKKEIDQAHLAKQHNTAGFSNQDPVSSRKRE